MFIVEYQQGKKWKPDVVKFADIEDAERCMIQWWEKGYTARVIEEREEEKCESD